MVFSWPWATRLNRPERGHVQRGAWACIGRDSELRNLGQRGGTTGRGATPRPGGEPGCGRGRRMGEQLWDVEAGLGCVEVEESAARPMSHGWGVGVRWAQS
jgi:hypothetical protein